MLEDPYYAYGDTWKDYPTASTVERLLHLKEFTALPNFKNVKRLCKDLSPFQKVEP